MDRFKLYKKWFWIGIIFGVFVPLWGLIYGIALWVEKDHRKEGATIVTCSIIWGAIQFYLIRAILSSIRLG